MKARIPGAQNQGNMMKKIQQMQEKKNSLAQSILNTDSVNIPSLSRKELMELFKL